MPINDYLPHGVVYLTHRIPYEGILFKVEPFFISPNPFYIQLWYQETYGSYSEIYRLVYQKKIESHNVNTTQAVSSKEISS